MSKACRKPARTCRKPGCKPGRKPGLQPGLQLARIMECGLYLLSSYLVSSFVFYLALCVVFILSLFVSYFVYILLLLQKLFQSLQ